MLNMICLSITFDNLVQYLSKNQWAVNFCVWYIIPMLWSSLLCLVEYYRLYKIDLKYWTNHMHVPELTGEVVMLMIFTTICPVANILGVMCMLYNIFERYSKHVVVPKRDKDGIR